MARTLTPTNLAKAYLLAKDFVIRSGFDAEIDWQEDLSLQSVSESDFLREMAWVVLSAGFRESLLRKHFPALSAAFLNWSSGREISQAKHECRFKALQAFNHEKKVDAILSTSELTAQIGFAALKWRIENEGVEFLKQLSFIGPVTAFHLAKNLGLSVVKPDRHLVRTAKAGGFACPTSMCQTIADVVAEKLSVVDLVIWRYATLNPDYEVSFFKPSRLG